MICSTETEYKKARIRLDFLIKNEKRFELKEIKPRRTLKTNSYLHLILSYGALEYGVTLEYFKRKIYKIKYNTDIFLIDRLNPKTGETYPDLKSSAELTQDEANLSIDRLRTGCSADMGIYLPDPDERTYLFEIEKEIQKNKRWL